MGLIEDLKASCQTQRSIRTVLRIFGATREETRQPLDKLSDEKARALVQNWLAWYGEREKQIELRMVEPKERTVYTVGPSLIKSAIYVRYVRNAPELVNKMLHHWNSTITYKTLSVEDIEDSVKREDILNMLGIVGNTNEEMSDFDLEL